jgi:Amt family ammonium transporter
MSINGFLGGLVAITAPCYWVNPEMAVLIGAIAGIVVPFATDALEHLRIDDPVGAVPVHLACGIWGTLSIGLFASGDFGIPTGLGADNTTPIEGLFYGGGTGQLVAQAIGSLSAIAVVGVLGFGLMYAVKSIKGSWGLRLAPEAELEGIDIFAHGLPAYHMEFGQGFSYSMPTGGSYVPQAAAAESTTPTST